MCNQKYTIKYVATYNNQQHPLYVHITIKLHCHVLWNKTVATRSVPNVMETVNANLYT